MPAGLWVLLGAPSSGASLVDRGAAAGAASTLQTPAVLTPGVNSRAVCNVLTQVDSPVTVFDGQILDSTFFHSHAGAHLAHIESYDDPQRGAIRAGVMGI